MEGTDRLACVIWLRDCVSTGDQKKKKEEMLIMIAQATSPMYEMEQS